MVHIHFSTVGALQVYLAIGGTMLLGRLVFAFGQWVGDEARKLANKHGVSMLRAAMTIHVCALALAFMAVLLWPTLAVSILRKWWAK